MSTAIPIKIRAVETQDLPAIHLLVQELAIFERAEKEVITTHQQYLQYFEEGWFDAIIAESDGKIIGMALFHNAFSTWKGPMIYLEDLIVTASMRGQGIGLQLLEHLYQLSKMKKAVLIKWQVLDWNQPAIEFYKKQGAELDAGWINCKKFL